METLTAFLGWCTVMNIGLLVLGGLAWIAVKEFVGELGAKMFGVAKEELKVTFFRVLMQFRAAIVILNLVPYIALKIMA
jgi:hypothetical protein